MTVQNLLQIIKTTELNPKELEFLLKFEDKNERWIGNRKDSYGYSPVTSVLRIGKQYFFLQWEIELEYGEKLFYHQPIEVKQTIEDNEIVWINNMQKICKNKLYDTYKPPFKKRCMK